MSFGKPMGALAPHMVCGLTQWLRWTLLGCVALICVGVTILTAGTRNTAPLPEQVRAHVLALQGFQTVVYGDEVRFRITGERLEVTPARFLGPFRFGFAHTLMLQHIVFEQFEKTPLQQSRGIRLPLKPILSALPSALEPWLSSIAPDRSRLLITAIDCGPLQIFQTAGTHSTLLFQAPHCYASLSTRQLTCRDGKLYLPEETLHFRKLTYDNHQGRLWLSNGQSRIIAE